jgi:hypothetical protein
MENMPPSVTVSPTRVTQAEYWAALDALTKARQIEEAKAAEGLDALAAWWRVAEPRWRELDALLTRAEGEDWLRAAVWYSLWAEARRLGVAPGTVNAPVPPGSLQGQGEVAQGQEGERSRRLAATAPRTRGIEAAGAI